MPKFIGVMLMGVAGIWHGMFGTHAPANNNQQYAGSYGQNSSQNRPVNPNGSSLIGTVSSIDGTMIVMQVIQSSTSTSATTTANFSVDASNARIIKSGSTTTAAITNIAVGDRIIAQGVIDGNSIKARLIIDTLPPQVAKPVVKPQVKTPTKTPAKTTKPATKK